MEIPYLDISYDKGLKVSVETVTVEGNMSFTEDQEKAFEKLMGSAIKDLEKLSIRSTPEGYETSITIEGYEFDAVIQYKFIPFERGEKGDYGQLTSPNVPAHIEIEGIKLKEGQFWREYDLPEQALTDILDEILAEHAS